MSILRAILSFIASIFSYIFGWFKGHAVTGHVAAPASSYSVGSWLMRILGWFGQGFKQCVDHPVTFVIVGSAFIGGWFVGFDMAAREAKTLETELSASKALSRSLQARLAAKPAPSVLAPAPLLSAPVELPRAPVVVSPLASPTAPPAEAPALVAAKKAHHAKKETASTWDPVTWNWHKYWSTTNKQ